MHRTDVDKVFIDQVRSNIKECQQDYDYLFNSVAKSNAIYKGKPCPFLYMPKFYTEADLNEFQRIANAMLAIGARVIKLYRELPSIRQKFGFSERLERLVMSEQHYDCQIPMSRIDIFYNDIGDFMLCEVNTDGTSAMNEDMVLGSIISNSRMMQALTKTYHISAFELFDTWIDELQAIYSEATDETGKPTVAIVDFIDKGSNIEFEEFIQRFHKKGYQAFIVDPTELSYDDGLYYNGQLIDVVYRRLVTRDMMARIDEIPAFEQACLDDKTVIIGNIRTQVVHTKLFFKMLFDEELRSHLDDDMLKFIDRHIPRTEQLADVIPQIDHYVDNKDQYILKPLDYYASIGVYAGRDYDEDAWRQLLLDKASEPYLIQAYYNPPQTRNIDRVDGQLVEDMFNNITGLFTYNGTVHGIYSRVGRNAILSGLHDVYTLPTYLVK